MAGQGINAAMRMKPMARMAAGAGIGAAGGALSGMMASPNPQTGQSPSVLGRAVVGAGLGAGAAAGLGAAVKGKGAVGQATRSAMKQGKAATKASKGAKAATAKAAPAAAPVAAAPANGALTPTGLYRPPTMPAGAPAHWRPSGPAPVAAASPAVTPVRQGGFFNRLLGR